MGLGDRLACAASCLFAVLVTIAISLVVFEGIKVPTFVPLIGGAQLVDGVIALRVMEARAGMVAASQLAAAVAETEKLKRDLKSAQTVAEEYRRRQLASDAEKEIANAKLEQIIADDAASGGCSWSDDDIQWLQRHR